MDITIFLARIWGPALLAIGLGIFVSRKYYVRLYRELEKETLSLLCFGIIAISAGIAHIHFHNIWQGLPQIIITLLGWATLIKGLVIIIMPGLADQGGNWQVRFNILPISGTLIMLLGAYLFGVGFL